MIERVARRFDVIVLGGGAAGLFAAATAGRRGKNVVVIEHMTEVGSKILISGGGRCNFTNLGANPAHYISANPHFCKSALARFRPSDFVTRLDARGIAYREKKAGQLFCVGSARDIVRMLVNDCQEAAVEIVTSCQVRAVRRPRDYQVDTDCGRFQASSLIVATGGLTLPRLGASDLGYRIAEQFELSVEPTRPGLVPLRLAEADRRVCSRLSGVSVVARISVPRASFHDSLLFTHRGLSGPAILQASSYWSVGEAVTIDLIPDLDLQTWFGRRRRAGSRAFPATLLSEKLPGRLAEIWCSRHAPRKPTSQISDREIELLATSLRAWTVTPLSTLGYDRAEVTVGGVSTRDLDSATMQARSFPGLFFVGEIVDVTGWLGGFNLHWAWASADAAGRAA